ncbi:HAD-like domain-containing protein [Lactarius hatsudake]|nr:HAD-like domain-containing protein [Lactarius hatsudake]
MRADGRHQHSVSLDGSVTVMHADLSQSNDILRVSTNTFVLTDGIVIGGSAPDDMKVIFGACREHNRRKQCTRGTFTGGSVWLIGLLACLPVILVVAIIVFVCNEKLNHGGRIVQAIATQCVKDMTVATFEDSRDDTVACLQELHPVAQSIAKYLHATYPHYEDLSIDKVQSILGKGLEVTTSYGVLIDIRDATLDGELVGFFGLTDFPRASAGAAVQLLQAQGIQVHIVSGDAAPVVHALASQLGVPPEFAHGGCLPAEKVAHVQELQASGGRVMFVGDGTNDTLALADVARDAVDIVSLAPDLERALGVLLRLPREAVRRVYMWACVYNLFAVLLAAGAFIQARIAPEYAGFGEMVP